MAGGNAPGFGGVVSSVATRLDAAASVQTFLQGGDNTTAEEPRSRAVLLKKGFKYLGKENKWLRIRGRWRHHSSM